MPISGDRKRARDGAKWIGTKGWVWVNRNAFESSNPGFGLITKICRMIWRR